MLSEALGAALALGLAGGVHCAAMCGPLAIGASCTEGRFAKSPALHYLGGRFLAYVTIGAAFGAFGQLLEASAYSRARLAGVLLVAVYFFVKGLRLFRATSSPPLVQLRRSRSRSFFALFPMPSRGLTLGLFTGLLPCGLLYGGFGLAASTATPIGGALVMAVLAATTLPGLFAPVLLRGALDRRFRRLRSPQLQGVLWCALALWLSFGPVMELSQRRAEVVMAEHALEPLVIPRHAWIHGSIALTASAFGFLASYVYLERSVAGGDPWALKMAMHMAAWHLLLVLTLFPVSVLGKRNGIRVVQAVSAVFFLIHVGIALANTDSGSLAGAGAWIAIFNAASGLFFAGGAAYGWRRR